MIQPNLLHIPVLLLMKSMNESKVSEILDEFTQIKDAVRQLEGLVGQVNTENRKNTNAKVEVSKNYEAVAKFSFGASILSIMVFIAFLTTASVRISDLEQDVAAQKIVNSIASDSRRTNLKATRDLLQRLEKAEAVIEKLEKRK